MTGRRKNKGTQTKQAQRNSKRNNQTMRASSRSSRSRSAERELPEPQEVAATTGEAVVPDEYLLLWSPGEGCPSLHCPGNRCGFADKSALRSHWEKFHTRTIRVWLCPGGVEPCSKTYRTSVGLNNHIIQVHSSLGADIRAVTRRNEKNVEPAGLISDHEWVAGQGCPVQGCHGEELILGTRSCYKKHWQRFHSETVPIWLCPEKLCETRFRDKPALNDHYVKKHLRLHIATCIARNGKYKVPRLPRQPNPPKEKEKDKPKEKKKEKVPPKVPMVPAQFLKAWSSGSGCPSTQCPSSPKPKLGSRRDLEQHWISYHEKKVKMFICPVCQKPLKQLDRHVKTQHKDQEVDIAGAEWCLMDNEKFVQPLLPETNTRGPTPTPRKSGKIRLQLCEEE